MLDKQKQTGPDQDYIQEVSRSLCSEPAKASHFNLPDEEKYRILFEQANDAIFI